MKNLHKVLIDKPTKLGYIFESESYHIFSEGENPYDILDNLANYCNIYIVSNEDIKEGDYSFYHPFGVGKNIIIEDELCFYIERKKGNGSYTQKTSQTLPKNQKIVLTTDTDLIASGIQAIDDEFLEWLVKNPNREEVGDIIVTQTDSLAQSIIVPHRIDYKIIIPE